MVIYLFPTFVLQVLEMFFLTALLDICIIVYGKHMTL